MSTLTLFFRALLDAWEQQERRQRDLAASLLRIEAAQSMIARRLTTLSDRITAMSERVNQIDSTLNTLRQDVAQNGDVVASAVALISGFGARLNAAIEAARAEGAQPAQLAAFTELHDQMASQRQALAAAVAANTEADPNTAGGQAGEQGAGTETGTGAATGETAELGTVPGSGGAAGTGTTTSTEGEAQADDPEVETQG